MVTFRRTPRGDWIPLVAILHGGDLRRGNGTWHLAFDVNAKSETPFGLRLTLLSNEKKFVKTIPTIACGDWARHEMTFDTDFDLAQTELVALSIMATAPANEIVFRNMSFVRHIR